MKTETKIQKSEVRGRRPAARSGLDCGGNKCSAAPLSDASARPEKLRRRFTLPEQSKTRRPFVGATRQSAALLPQTSHRRFAKRRHAVLALVFSTIISQLSTSLAQSYSIDWHTIDGGGGTSTGSVYSVSGTIGQPDAGSTMTNGQYSVTGGFWALPTAVQTTNAPTLTIVPATPGNATISWTPNTPGFVLQETLSLSPTNWTNSLSGATNPILIPATLPSKFYRLSKP